MLQQLMEYQTVTISTQCLWFCSVLVCLAFQVSLLSEREGQLNVYEKISN